MKGDFRPLIRPDLADRINSKAAELNLDKTELTNIMLDLCMEGTLTLEIQTKNQKIKVADNTYIISSTRMRRDTVL